MDYSLLKEVIDSVEQFEKDQSENFLFSNDMAGYKKWLIKEKAYTFNPALTWEGKQDGRGIDSVINTLFIHMNRYARSYSKSVIFDSGFASQEDFIYLINLNVFGPMTKMDLIKKSVHEKSPGMQIINRLIDQGWIMQTDDLEDRRSKTIELSKEGKLTLESHMDKIRLATKIVAGDLSRDEKLTLIDLLQRLDAFHYSIYSKNVKSEDLLKYVSDHFPYMNEIHS